MSTQSVQNTPSSQTHQQSTNHLSGQTSQYLLQHSNNPVDWYPWGEEAFQKAKAEDKPIFLSIGYSTCHGCNIMAKESFENAETAQILNENFVAIKVDREERPDLEQNYMTFILALTGSSGWPISVFLTPEIQPITGGTSFPSEAQYGTPAFSSILQNIAKQWNEKKDKIKIQATSVIGELENIYTSQKKIQSLLEKDDFLKLDASTGGSNGVSREFNPKQGEPGIIDGKKVAEDIRKSIKTEIDELKQKYNRVPGLAVVLVGERKDSQTYVRNKRMVCEQLGVKQFNYDLDESTTEESVLQLVDELNNNQDVNGILVQLPLPKHINDIKVLDKISVKKDVDGFHPEHMGKIGMRGREPDFVPCTAKGCMELLQRYKVEVAGKKAVVIGRSNIVGLPVQLMLQNLNATVTGIHSKTKNPESISREADIVVAACGQREFIKKEWIKPGAVVIDVGMNTKDDPNSKRGYRLCGDVDFENVKDVASLITPVPGGVGPMTIAILMQNTLLSFKRLLEQNK